MARAANGSSLGPFAWNHSCGQMESAPQEDLLSQTGPTDSHIWICLVLFGTESPYFCWNLGAVHWCRSIFTTSYNLQFWMAIHFDPWTSREQGCHQHPYSSQPRCIIRSFRALSFDRGRLTSTTRGISFEPNAQHEMLQMSWIAIWRNPLLKKEGYIVSLCIYICI